MEPEGSLPHSQASVVLRGGELGRSNNEEYGLRVFEKWVLGGRCVPERVLL